MLKTSKATQPKSITTSRTKVKVITTSSTRKSRSETTSITNKKLFKLSTTTPFTSLRTPTSSSPSSLPTATSSTLSSSFSPTTTSPTTTTSKSLLYPTLSLPHSSLPTSTSSSSLSSLSSLPFTTIFNLQSQQQQPQQESQLESFIITPHLHQQFKNQFYSLTRSFQHKLLSQSNIFHSTKVQFKDESKPDYSNLDFEPLSEESGSFLTPYVITFKYLNSNEFKATMEEFESECLGLDLDIPLRTFIAAVEEHYPSKPLASVANFISVNRTIFKRLFQHQIVKAIPSLDKNTTGQNEIVQIIFDEYHDLTTLILKLRGKGYTYEEIGSLLRKIYPKHYHDEIDAVLLPKVSSQTPPRRKITSFNTFSDLIGSLFTFRGQSEITFESIQHLLQGEWRFLSQLFLSHQELLDSFIRSPNDDDLQMIYKKFGQSIHFLSQSLVPIESSGRSMTQLHDYEKREGIESKQDQEFFQIPSFQSVTPLQLNEYFSAPQRSILFYGTLTHEILERDTILRKGLKFTTPIEQLRTCPQIIQLANELSVSEEDLESFLNVLSTCRTLAFPQWQHNLDPRIKPDTSYTVSVGRTGLGKSTLFLLKCIIYHRLKIPFCHVANRRILVVRAPDDSDYYSLIHIPSTSSTPEQYYLCKSTNITAGFHLVGNHSIVSFDCPDPAYDYQQLKQLSDEMKDKVQSSQSIITSFSSASKRIVMYFDGKNRAQSLPLNGIFPFYLSPTKANYLLGMTQLHLYHHLQHQLKSFLQLSPADKDSYFLEPPTAPSTALDNYLQKYFGLQLFQSTKQFNQEFYQFLQESKNRTLLPVDKQTKTINDTYYVPPDLLRTIETKFINNHQNQSLFGQIISHPMVDFLLPKQFTVMHTDSQPGYSQSAIVTDAITSELQINTQQNIQNKEIKIIPAFYMVPRRTPKYHQNYMNFDTDVIEGSFKYNPASFDRTKLSQQWLQFPSSISSSRLTSQNHEQQQHTSLLTQIHHLWNDLSIFKLYGEPSTRLYRLLSSKPQKADSSYIGITSGDLLSFNKQAIRPTLLESTMKLQSTPHTTSTKDYELVQKLQTDRIPNSTSFGFEVNYIDTLLQAMDRFQCYLPFSGFHDLPIRRIYSFNKFYNLQLHQSTYYQPQEIPDIDIETIFPIDFIKLLKQQPKYNTLDIIIPRVNHPGIDLFVSKKTSKGHHLLGIQLTSGKSTSKHDVKVPNYILTDLPKSIRFSYAFVTSSLPNKIIHPDHEMSYFQLTSPQLILDSSQIKSQIHHDSTFFLTPAAFKA